MKKITLKQLGFNLLYVVVGIVIAVGLSYTVQAAPFADNSNPPENNTAFPLNVGAGDQVKTGGLSVLGFIANANAQLGNGGNAETYFAGLVLPQTSNPNATITIGGTDAVGGLFRVVNMLISGTFSNTGVIASDTIANGSGSKVCSNADGFVVLCTDTAVPGEKGQYVATGNTSGFRSGFNPYGPCYNGSGNQNINGTITYVEGPYTFFKQVGSCGSYANGDAYNGGNVYGHVVKVAFQNTIKNTLPGVYGASEGPMQFVGATLVPDPFWVVQKTGIYKIDYSGTIGVKGVTRDGNFLMHTGFFMLVKNAQNTSETWYPLVDNPSWKGLNAPVTGYSNDCAGKTLGSLSGGGNVIGINSTTSLYVNNSDIQYSIMGSCKNGWNDFKEGNWTAEGSYTVGLHRTLQLTAGDKVYLYGKIAGKAWKRDTDGGFNNSGIDGRDVDVTITQTNNQISIIEQ